MKKVIILIVFIMSYTAIYAGDLYPIWIEFPAEQLLNTEDGYKYDGFGKLYLSAYRMSIRYEGLRVTAEENDDGEGILKIFSIPIKMSEFTPLDNFEYSFEGITEDKYQDRISGYIAFDAKSAFEGAGYIGSILKFVMKIYSGHSSREVLHIQNPAWEESDYYFNKYKEISWGDDFVTFEEK
ncbi:MAG: hypothetical protein JEZ04_10075 [Spirochaetales bacterium]|nr:hypothetical protein [Spirochaetales bacterium]